MSVKTLHSFSKYTARQMCSIALLVPPFCLTAGVNICLNQYLKDLSWSSDKFLGTLWSNINYVQSLSVLLLGSVDFPNCPKAVAYLCWLHSTWAVASCKLPSQTKVVIMVTDTRLIIIDNIVQFHVLSFLRGRYRELLECHKVPYKSDAMFVRVADCIQMNQNGLRRINYSLDPAQKCPSDINAPSTMGHCIHEGWPLWHLHW